MMAWPRALHGISVVHLGESHWKVLRSGAVRALKADRKGANPYLHLASSQVQSDPEAWSILQTLRDVRELGDHEVVEPTLGLFSSNLDFLPANGPSAILLSRLRRLGWEVGSQGQALSRTVWVLSAFCVLPGMSWWCGLDLLGGTFWQLLWHIALPLMDSNMWTCLSWPLPCRVLVPLTWCICVVT